MDDGRGYVAERYWTGGSNDKTIINRIMLRYRPIAPKPANGGSGSVESSLPENKNSVDKGRPKRKYSRANKNSSRCKANKDVADRTVLTLQLLPEVAGRKDSSTGGSCGNLDFPMIHDPVQQLPAVWLNFDSSKSEEEGTTIAFGASDQLDLTAVAPPVRVVESCVMVECVTDTCMNGGGLGTTDVERIRNLEVDTCPAFVSDGVHYRVQWTNLAYRRMVWAEEEGGGSPPETAVQMVVKAELPVCYPSFTCRVRVRYTWRKEKYSTTVPCDVWRMDFGGFAWKLDLKAALCLGR